MGEQRIRELILVTAWIVGGCAAPASPASTAPARVETVAPARSRVLLLRTGSSRVALFPEELEALRHDAHSFLERQRDTSALSIVPMAELDALEHLAQAGYSRPGGPKCAAPTSFYALAREYYGQTPRASLTAACAGVDCTISLRIEQPPPHTGVHRTLVTWEARIEGPPSLSAFRAAMRRLAIPPSKADVGGLLGMVSIERDPHAVRLLAVHAPAGWAVPPTLNDFAGVRPALSGCHESGWHSAKNDSAVLSVGSDGKIARCSIESGDQPARLERLKCLCRALQGAVFPPASGERRLVVDLMNSPESAVKRGENTVGARFDDVVSGDGSELRHALAGAALPVSKCYAATPEADRIGFNRSSVHLAVDSVGRVTSATVDGQIHAGSALAVCVEQALRATAFPCTKTGVSTTLDANLVLYVHRER